MMEMANTSLSHDEIVQLVDQMFVTSGLERRNSLRFKDFTRVLSVRMDMLWDVCLDWKGQFSSGIQPFYLSGNVFDHATYIVWTICMALKPGLQ
jgi:hypothetical protein